MLYNLTPHSNNIIFPVGYISCNINNVIESKKSGDHPFLDTVKLTTTMILPAFFH